ncbi:hypothetical protein L6164_001027 [Bauhinia variegata]|uniref:Uncharacterized protein n=1 Tax=Bauhinia variegata TaxID=167791 RepID=A0ACB9Q8G9_BAUVA|nr:hypothetical protein L6164_001027 [Bauhinia variegata]
MGEQPQILSKSSRKGREEEPECFSASISPPLTLHSFKNPSWCSSLWDSVAVVAELQLKTKEPLFPQIPKSYLRIKFMKLGSSAIVEQK